MSVSGKAILPSKISLCSHKGPETPLCTIKAPATSNPHKCTSVDDIFACICSQWTNYGLHKTTTSFIRDPRDIAIQTPPLLKVLCCCNKRIDDRRRNFYEGKKKMPPYLEEVEQQQDCHVQRPQEIKSNEPEVPFGCLLEIGLLQDLQRQSHSIFCLRT